MEIALLGDVMLGRGVNQELANRSLEYCWGDTLTTLRSADAVFANLECAITEHMTSWSKTPKVFHFRADPRAAEILKIANIKCVTLANNHILEFEEEGLFDTLKHLDKSGIAHAGAGHNIQEAQAPIVISCQGFKIGFIAYTDNEPPFAATETRPGTNYIQINTDQSTLARLAKDIDIVKNNGAEFIILSLHWGPNMVQVPSKKFQNFAKAAIELGVNLIHGHSAHIFQAVEFYQNGVILYNTGDFIDDYAVDLDLRNDWSFIFLIELDGRIIKKVRALPVKLHYAFTNLATKEDAELIYSRMQQLCRSFGTITEVTNEGLIFRSL